MTALEAFAKPSGPGGGEPYTITGEVDGVVPGLASTLPIRLDNPNRFAIEVQALGVAVGDASPDCVSTNLIVGPAGVPVTVPARGTTAVDVPVRFADDPADACQGAEFPLAYHGTAVRADPATPSPSPTPSPTPTPTPKPKPTPKPR